MIRLPFGVQTCNKASKPLIFAPSGGGSKSWLRSHSTFLSCLPMLKGGKHLHMMCTWRSHPDNIPCMRTEVYPLHPNSRLLWKWFHWAAEQCSFAILDGLCNLNISQKRAPRKEHVKELPESECCKKICFKLQVSTVFWSGGHRCSRDRRCVSHTSPQSILYWITGLQNFVQCPLLVGSVLTSLCILSCTSVLYECMVRSRENHECAASQTVPLKTPWDAIWFLMMLSVCLQADTLNASNMTEVQRDHMSVQPEFIPVQLALHSSRFRTLPLTHLQLMFLYGCRYFHNTPRGGVGW